MAWNATKQAVLKDLIEERVTVERTPGLVEKWQLTTSWLGILNSHVTDTIKQNVLNDLIDDKVAYLQILMDTNSAENTAFQGKITQGLSLKE